MKRINNKGYTLIEILAVVAILGMLIAIMIPNVNKLINKNEKNNIEQFNVSIRNAAKLYISDYKYEITVDISSCPGKITKVNGTSITNSKIPISILVKEGNLKTNKDGNIVNPKDKNSCLDLDDTTKNFIEVTYDCNKKDYIYDDINIDNLEWKSPCN